MATPKKWTKKDIKTLCGQLDSFWVYNRMYYPSEAIARVIGEKRQDIVIGNLRGFQNMVRERAQKDREGAEHARTSGVWGKSTDEMVQRFTKGAEESEKSVAKIDQLIARIEAEGLPPEVAEYMPEGLRK